MPIEPAATTGRLSRPPTENATFEERRLLTILFADLSGFTALCSKLDPEEVREAANLCFERLNKAIIAQGGTIHKYEGDLVMALFGHPVAHEDDPERAIRASFAMLGLLSEVNRALSARLGKECDIGLHAGINSGTVVVGEMGSSEKKEFTVMGDAVNLASRLKDLAQRGEIVVSEAVFRASRYLFEYEAREPVTVKGIEEPVKVFRPLKEKTKPDPKRGIKGLFSPLVGREKEQAALLESVARLAEGQGGVTFVIGDAGLGKSRLLAELKQALPGFSLPVALLEGRCLLYGENVPYWPFLQILRTIFGITEQDEKDRVRDRLLKRTQEIFPESWQDIAPYLGYLFSVRFEEALDEKVKYLDAKSLRTQIFLSVRKLLAALSESQPLLLVLEDYHWLDAESLKLLEFLFDAPFPLPMVALALSRRVKNQEGHKTQERLKAKLGAVFQEILLAPLTADAGSQLVRNLLEESKLPVEFQERILSQAEGNPFYLEEIVRSLIDSNTIAWDSGIWRLASDTCSFSIPDTVQAVIASRLDRLEKDVREVLQIAAVIGRTFNASILENLCGIASLMLTLYLAELEEHEYISVWNRDPDLEYAFRHPLLQEVAYNGLLKRRRRELHRKAGGAIEALYRDRLEEFTELLAHQYAQGDDPEKAVAWLQKAGQKAVDRYAHDEAIAYFQQLASILDRELKDRAGELSAAQEAIGYAYYMKGEMEPALQAYEAMGRAADGNRLVQARSLIRIVQAYQKQSRFDESLEVLDRAEKMLAVDLPEEAFERANIRLMRCMAYQIKGDLERSISEGEAGLNGVAALLREGGSGIDPRKVKLLKAVGLNRLGTAYWHKAEYSLAIEYLEDLIGLSEEVSEKQGLSVACGNLGVLYHDLGDYARAVPYYERSLALAEAIGDRQQMILICGNLGIVNFDRGNYEKALELNHYFLRNAEEIGAKRGMVDANNNLGQVYQEQGDYARAREFFQRALDLAGEIGFRRAVGVACLNLGSLFLKTGDREEAERTLFKAEQILSEVMAKFDLIYVYTSLAILRSQASGSGSGPDPEVVAYLDKAGAISREIGSKFTTPHCDFTSGKIYAAAGDYPKSEEHFQKAVTMYDELGQRKNLADAYLEYARMLKRAAEKGLRPPALAETYFSQARGIYEDLKLPHMVQECL